jgi:hypothetical protein
VRNLPILSIEFTSLEARSSDIPPQRAGGSSETVGWDPTVLACHNRELVMKIKATISM